MPNGTKPKTGGGKKFSAPVPDGAKSKKALVIVIILVVLLLVAAAGGGIYFFFAKLGISKNDLGFLGKSVADKPIGIPEMAVSQEIPAAEGGTIKAPLPSGYVATLTIPKGALKKDTRITLTPFAPVGRSGGSQNPPGQNPPGGNNPPANPPGGGGGNNPPGGNPPGDEPPADEPPGDEPPADNPPEDEPPGDDDSGLPDLTDLFPTGDQIPPIINPFGSGIGGVIITPDDLIFDIPAIISFNPPGASASTPGVATTEPATGVIVHTDPNGDSTIIPGSGSGGSAGGPIGGGGSVSGDPPTQDEAERIAEDTARASGGTCTPEFIAAVRAMADIPGYPAGSIMARTLDDCLNLDWIREKCQNDPTALRRLYFQERLRIAAALEAPREKVDEINRLENECVARYEISGSGSGASPGGGPAVPPGMMRGTASLWVCGYLDDTWQGSMTYQNVPPDLPAAGHYFSGTVNALNLPPRGGPFGAEAAPDSHVGGGGLVDLSGIPLGLWGNFDGERTLNPLWIYAVYAGEVPIIMTERPCIPLAPLGN